MFTNILVPADSGHPSDKASAAAVKLARELNARIIGAQPTPAFAPIHHKDIAPPPKLISPAAQRKRMRRHVRQLLDALGRTCAATDAAYEPLHAPDVDPHAVVIKIVERLRCHHVLMTSHGCRGVADLRLGSET